jgi:hypothetical protein
VRLFGDHATQVACVDNGSDRTNRSRATSQTVIVPSVEAKASKRPSGDQASCSIGSLYPDRTCFSLNPAGISASFNGCALTCLCNGRGIRWFFPCGTVVPQALEKLPEDRR